MSRKRTRIASFYFDILLSMSQDEVVKHWKQGAQDALEAADALHKLGKYALALFDCHLAVEKALKAAYIARHDKEPPPTHNLVLLAEELDRTWTKEEREALSDLTDYAVAARYDDPQWAREKATENNSFYWLQKTKHLLATFV